MQQDQVWSKILRFLNAMACISELFLGCEQAKRLVKIVVKNPSIDFHNPIRVSVHNEKIKKRIKRIDGHHQDHLCGRRTSDVFLPARTLEDRHAGGARERLPICHVAESAEAGRQFFDSGRHFRYRQARNLLCQLVSLY